MGWQKTGSLRPTFAAQATSVSDGTFTVALPAGAFGAVPVVTHGVVNGSGDGRDYVVTLTAVSTTSISGQVRKSRTLPAVVGALAVLANYDTFVPAAGVTVGIHAQRAT